MIYSDGLFLGVLLKQNQEWHYQQLVIQHAIFRNYSFYNAQAKKCNSFRIPSGKLT